MQGYKEIANSPILWVVTFIAIGLVLFQTIRFLQKSFYAGRKMGISDDKLKLAFKTGAISAVGPSVVVVTGMVSLLIVVGGPTALMRLAYIGNVAYELLAVEFAADAYGVSTADPNILPQVFVVALWCMAVGCIGWIIMTALFTDKMDKVERKLAGKKAAMIPVISSGAMLGAYGYLTAGYAVSLDERTVSFLGGFGIMLAVLMIYKRTKSKVLNEWGLTIAMLGGILIAAFF